MSSEIMTGAFSTIIPSDLVCEESSVMEYSIFNQAGNNEEIHPLERDLVLNAPQKRQNEFITGRICAKRALKKFKIHDYPVLFTKYKLPLFPETIVGSIAHTSNHCAIVLGLRKNYSSIGIDVENLSKIKQSYFDTLCTENELLFLKNYAENEQLEKAAIIFSAKEAFYKLQFHLTHKMLYFKDVCCTIQDENNFAIKLLKHVDKRFSCNSSFSGSYNILNGLVFTVLHLCNE